MIPLWRCLAGRPPAGSPVWHSAAHTFTDQCQPLHNAWYFTSMTDVVYRQQAQSQRSHAPDCARIGERVLQPLQPVVPVCSVVNQPEVAKSTISGATTST